MNELYHQMTLDEWVASKKRIREMIRTAKTAFIVIGYELRKIDEAEAYKMDGYTSLADFAKGEYGFEKTMTSRLVEVNKAFSEGGYSDILIEDAEGFSFSKLIEMKDLDKEDLQLLRPEVKREDIRELKKFEAEAPDGREGAEGIDELLVEFFRKRKEQLNEIFGRFRDGILSEETELAEIISPTGNVAFRKGMWMAFFYADGITLKDRAGGVTKWTYTELFCEMSRIFGDAAAAGEKTWEAYYGEPEEESAAETQQEEQKPEQSDQKPEQSGQKPEQSGQKPEKTDTKPQKPEKEQIGKEEPKSGEESADESGESRGVREEHAGEAAGAGQDPEPAAEEDGGEREGNPGGEEKAGIAEEQERTAEPVETVAPAQQHEETSAVEERETDRNIKNAIAERLDQQIEDLTKHIGEGHYAAALECAEGMCKNLRTMLDLLKE